MSLTASERILCSRAAPRQARRPLTSTSAAHRIVTARVERPRALSPVRVMVAVLVGVPVVLAVLALCGVA